MRVLVCGDRHWADADKIRQRLERLPEGNVTVVEGMAPGADTLGRIEAEKLGLRVESFPANWGRYGRAAGPIRNQEMLDSSPDLVLAFHSDLSQSKGTKDMVKRARAKGVEVEVFE